MNRQIRNLEENIVNALNESQLPYECKRVVLENLMLKCEMEAIKDIAQEPITEKGELENECNS